MNRAYGNIILRYVFAACISFFGKSLFLFAQYAPQVETLVQQMTVAEKAGQMTQLNLDVVCVGDIYNLEEPHRLDSAKLYTALVQYHVGSILNYGGHAYTLSQWHTLIAEIQKVATQKTRLKIPVIYGIDAIHGANYTLGSTLFPQPLAQAASWNPELVQTAAEITAYEVRATGIPWNFSPILDLGRQPRWSRFFETYGEDVLLAKRMGAAMVKGYQGNDISSPYHLAACMKHFLGYSFPFSGKDRTPAYISDIQLREYFLPPFEAAIAAGASTIMINSAEINGIPVHADKKILTTLLRDELGFKGVAVTDWEDVEKLHTNHKVAATMKEAVYLAVDAGIDMCMVPNDFDFTTLLIELVEEGTISEERLDISVRRILQLKYDLGLFENPFSPATTAYHKFGSGDFAEVSQHLAEESITLLKNKNTLLPLDENAKILITGVAANSMTYLKGAWSRTWQGTDTAWNSPENITIARAFNSKNTKYISNAVLQGENGSSELNNAADAADVILYCMGELPSTEKPGDANNLAIANEQLNTFYQLAETGKPLILILIQNRPLLVHDIEPLCDAIILAYQPGDYGGIALKNIVFGETNPSGKLPFTYPRYEGSIFWYDHKHTETIDINYRHTAFNPQWEFGYGLSYTTFTYSNLIISSDTLSENPIVISVDVTNSGSTEGKEVVQLFIADRFASITPPVKRLRDFKKIALDPGETKNIQFTIEQSDLAFVGKDLQWITEAGWFDVYVGNTKNEFYLLK